jgi:hypothetical protein
MLKGVSKNNSSQPSDLVKRAELQPKKEPTYSFSGEMMMMMMLMMR